MNVLFTRREDGQLERQVYQKKTHTNRYMQYNSHHPVEIKSGIIQGLVYRAMNVCSDRSGRNKEIKLIKDVMQRNGYPRKFTEKAIRRQMKRGTIPKQKEIDDKKLQTARIPFIDDVRQKVRRLAREAGVTAKCLVNKKLVDW